MNLTNEEANVILQFLDRVATTGHQERNAMNVVVEKLAQIAQATAQPVEEPKVGKTEEE